MQQNKELVFMLKSLQNEVLNLYVDIFMMADKDNIPVAKGRVKSRKMSCDMILKTLLDTAIRSIDGKNEKIEELQKNINKMLECVNFFISIIEEGDGYKIKDAAISVVNQTNLIILLLNNIIVESEAFDYRYDGLTGLFNRKSFLNSVYSTIYGVQNPDEGDFTSRVTGKKFTIILSDIDFFKNINDTYGHLAGDFVLSEVGRIFKEGFRDNDVVGRYGGEEFIAVIDAEAHIAKNIAERVRKGIEDHVFFFDNKRIKLTCSFGLAQNNKTSTLPSLIKQADDALYFSKETGRNRVTIG